MIVTVTPNPSIDRTVTLPGELVRGAVHRVTSVTSEPGGKGVNVARALTLAGVETVAVLPAAGHDPILAGLREQGVEFHAVPVSHPVRTNLAITETDGTTTKVNEPGAALDATEAESLAWAVVQRARAGHWVVLSGSLPPGLPDAWYSEMTAALRAHGCQVAVDTSDAPLAALAAGLHRAAPDLMKPNAEELAGLTGVSAESLESPLARGDAGPVVAAARHLVEQGVGAVLATLGAAGAVLVDGDGAWLATPPPVTAVSTVGAGDSSLAGYIRAEVAGLTAPERLQMAVAYGSAAAALPGSALPSPAHLNLDGVSLTALAEPPEGVS
ncbi:MAG TPA: 1-phosphofructokinase [Mycobacterium sp.]|nr:1-phosphofructokinase [Mycobacterium sp.]